jgi:hypothetical protein
MLKLADIQCGSLRALYIAAGLRPGRILNAKISDRPLYLGKFSYVWYGLSSYIKVVILLLLETLVSSLIVTAILKGSNTGFKKTDKLMKRIAV